MNLGNMDNDESGLKEVSLLRLGPNFRFFESSFSMFDQVYLNNVSARPETGQYIIIISICDYTRVLERNIENQIFYDLEEAHISDLQAKRALLLLDLSNEGPSFNVEIFSAFHQQATDKSIPLNSIVFISQNRRMAADYKETYGNTGLNFFTLDYFPLSIVRMFNIKSQDKDLENYEISYNNKDKIFNCLNSAPRWHRVLIYRWLQEKELLNEGFVSFHGTSSSNPKGNEINIDYPPYLLSEAFPHLISDLKNFLPAEPLRFDSSNDFGNALSNNIPIEVYKRSSLSIITESDFFESSTERFTEKTIKAVAMGLPFIVIGSKKTVRLIRSLGFKTFDNVIDHSYDDLDDIDRMNASMQTIQRTIGFIRSDLMLWNKNTEEDANFNLNHARHGLADRFFKNSIYPIFSNLENFVSHREIVAEE